jgi:hypothetical protein
MTLSISSSQHHNALPSAEFHYSERRVLFSIMLSDIMLNVNVLSAIMLIIVMLSDVAL